MTTEGNGAEISLGRSYIHSLIQQIYTEDLVHARPVNEGVHEELALKELTLEGGGQTPDMLGAMKTSKCNEIPRGVMAAVHTVVRDGTTE